MIALMIKIDTFANPQYLWLLLLLVPLIVWYVLKQKNYNPSLRLSTTKPFEGLKPSVKVWSRHILFVFRIVALALLIFILARPQSKDVWKDVSVKGIDIMLDLDVSGSMLARDFKPDRLEAAKEVATQFINDRPNDRIGLVIFAGEAFTQCPLTADHAALINLLKDVKTGLLEDGTAIGEGLATAVNRLKDSQAKSKTIILLTDGVNNSGSVDPLTAAEIAKTYGIRVYTIGVGTYGEAPYPVQTPFGIQYQPMKVEIDEPLLKQIAQTTGGEYFRATNKKKLEEIYRKIDKLEKTKIKVKEMSKKTDQYIWFGITALVLLLVEFVLRHTIYRNIP